MTTITIRRAEGTWTVRAGGAILGESHNALLLREEGHVDVVYFPREDIAMAFLDRSPHRTRCPLKGEACHFSIVTKSRTLRNAAWSYETPTEAAAPIRDHIAFYPSEDVTVERI